MRRLLWILVFLLGFAAVAAAQGVRLHNRDDRAYHLVVQHREATVHTAIQPHTVARVCAAECTITVQETQATLRAPPGTLVVLEHGRLRAAR